MAIQTLTQPIINPIAAFDANYEQIISFVVIGGAQVVGNRLVIINNQTGSIIYNNTQSSIRLEHVIPANTLTNGGYYSATIYTIDNANNESQASVAVPFYCYTTPILAISNIPTTEIIENSTYTFEGIYTQLEREELSSYQFILYNNNKEVSSKSDVIYYQTDNSLSYTFIGMSNGSAYYVELQAQTVNNTKITTGLLYFTIQYIEPTAFSVVDLQNNCEEGYIRIASNVVAIDGYSNPDPPIYIDNKEVDLRDPDSWVKWQEGFDIQNDFTMRIWGRDFNDNEPIVTMTNELNSEANPNKIELKWMNAYIIKDLPFYESIESRNALIEDNQGDKLVDLNIYGDTRQTQLSNMPSPDYPSEMFSVGDKKNLINVSNFNVTYEDQYYEATNTNYILKPGFVYTLSFDYLVNDASTDIYYSIGYGVDSYSGNIEANLLYMSQDRGTNHITFMVPNDISNDNYLWVKFAQTAVVGFVNVDISNIQLETGKQHTEYQNPNIYTIYPTTCERNLLNYNSEKYVEANGCTYTSINNGYHLVSNGGGYRLPSEYQEVEYIESSGTQYIDTGFKMDNNTTFDYEFEFIGESDDSDATKGFIFGGDSLSNKACAMWINFSNSYYYFRQSYNILTRNVVCPLNVRQHITMSDGKVWANNVEISPISSSTFKTVDNAYLFGNNSVGTFSDPINMKLYNFKLYDDGILIRDFVPCYVKSTNEIGLYDLVGGEFYSNEGTGTFNKGENVYPPGVFKLGYNNILLPNETYRMSYQYDGDFSYLKLYSTYKDTKDIIEEIPIVNGIFTTPDNLYDLQISVGIPGETGSNVDIWNMQITKGATLYDYAIYNSHNVEINISDSLKSIDNYRDVICVNSINLLNPSDQIAIVKSEETYYFSQNSNVSYTISYLNEGGNVISSISIITGSFTTPSNCKKVRLENATSQTITLGHIQISSEDLPYYPYVSEPSLIRQIGTTILTGDEIWDEAAAWGNNSYYIEKPTHAMTWGALKSNSFVYHSDHTPVQLNNEMIMDTNIVVNNPNTTTVSDFVAWLEDLYEARTPVIIHYVLSEPEVIPLSIDIVEALENVETFPIMNVFTNNSNLGLLKFKYENDHEEQETQNAYILLRCYNMNNMPYVVHSNYIDIPKTTDTVFIWCRRENNLFDLKIENLGVQGG